MSGRTCRAENSQASRIVRPEFGPGQRAWPAAGWLFPEGRSPGSGVKRSEDASVAGHLGVTLPRCLAKTGGAGPRGVHVRGRVHTLPMLSSTYSRFKKKNRRGPPPRRPASWKSRHPHETAKALTPAPQASGTAIRFLQRLSHISQPEGVTGRELIRPGRLHGPVCPAELGAHPGPLSTCSSFLEGSAGVVGGQAASA